MPFWAVHGDGRRVADEATVAPGERLGWLLTMGFGAQHLLVMAGVALVVPVFTGLPPSTTLLFSGIGTLLFLALTRNRLPAYLGSSVAFVAPLQAAQASGLAAQLGGVLVVGLVLAAVGVAVKALGNRVIDAMMPPVVVGAVVVLIGLSLAPAAVGLFRQQPAVGVLTALTVLVAVAVLPSMGGRFALLAGIAAGWGAAVAFGLLAPSRTSALADASWVGLPTFTSPQVTPSVVLGMLPVVIVLVAETIGGVRAVGAVTGHSVDGVTGDALVGNGLATTLAGLGGGAGTTMYPQNTGVLAASRVFSTAAYVVAAVAAIALAFSPKAAALLLTMPPGVVGGASLVLYGLVGMHGVRVWVDSRVDLRDPLTLMIAATAVVAGVGNIAITIGDTTVGGAVWGTIAILVLYPGLRWLRRLSWAGPREPEPERVARPGGVGWQLGQK